MQRAVAVSYLIAPLTYPLALSYTVYNNLWKINCTLEIPLQGIWIISKVNTYDN